MSERASHTFIRVFSMFLSLRLFGHAPSLVPQDYIQQFHLCPVRTRAVRLHRPDKSGILFRPNPVSDPITASETNKFFVEKKKKQKNVRRWRNARPIGQCKKRRKSNVPSRAGASNKDGGGGGGRREEERKG